MYLFSNPCAVVIRLLAIVLPAFFPGILHAQTKLSLHADILDLRPAENNRVAYSVLRTENKSWVQPIPFSSEIFVLRSLNAHGPWFAYTSGVYGGTQHYDGDPLFDVSEIEWRRFPIEVSPVVIPSGVALPNLPTVWMSLVVHVAGNGAVYARWHSRTGSGPVFAVFPPAGSAGAVEFRSPAEWPAGANQLPLGHPLVTRPGSLPATAPLALFLLVVPSTIPVESFPAEESLDLLDEEVRSAIISTAPAVREQLWRENPPTADVPPPTLESRSYFRAVYLDPWPDSAGNGNGLPDNFDAYWKEPTDAQDHLIIMEACFANSRDYDLSQYNQPANVDDSRDWVELMNPTNHDIVVSAATQFFLTDSTLNKEKWPVPHGTYGKGACILISPAGMDLADKGSTLYLYRKTGATPVEVDTMTGPPGNAFPGRGHANVSWGRHPLPTGSGNASFETGFFDRPTPGRINRGHVLSGATAEPSIVDASSTANPKPELKGKLFRSGVVKVELKHSDSSAQILFTLDGSDPGLRGSIYMEPFEITGSCVVRARAVLEGKLPSQLVTRSFIHTPSAMLAPHHIASGGLAVLSAFGFSATPFRANHYQGSGTVLDQLEAIPSVFVSRHPQYEGEPPYLEHNELPAGNGADGIDQYPASFEYHDPANPSAWGHGNCFIQESSEVPDNPGPKKSFDLLFTSKSTLDGADMWTGPATGSGSNATSLIFPGSKVTKWRKLVLRHPYLDSFTSQDYVDAAAGPFGVSTGEEVTYLADAWFRRLQQDARSLPLLGAVMPKDVVMQRRWVHLWLNGKYHGVYDLTEAPDQDTISSHLIAALPPGATQAQINALAPHLIHVAADKPGLTTAGASSAWETQVRLPCAAAFAAPGNTSLYNGAIANVDVPSYMRLCSLIEFSYPYEIAPHYRAYRDPGDGKWRFIFWGCDRHRYGDWNVPSRNLYLNLPNSGNQAPQSPRILQPLYYLKGITQFKNTFHSQMLLDKDTLFGLVDNGVRFDGVAADFRKVLEVEAMRWHGMYALDQWSYRENIGSDEFPNGVENSRSHLTGEDLVVSATNFEITSRHALYTTANEVGLYQDTPPEE